MKNRRLPGNLENWRRGVAGATAIEFSLVAIPLFIAVIGIIELAFMFAASSLLQGAVYDAARLIRTGQAQQSADPEDMFRDALCDHVMALIDCGSVQLQVSTIESFDDVNTVPEIDEEGNLVGQEFAPGGAREIVMIRTVYMYPLMTPFIGQLLSDYPGNKKLLTSTVALETEPYNFGDG